MHPYAETLAQHAAMLNGVGVADISDRMRLAIQGADRVAFLHSFCTNDIKQLRAGQGCEAFITSTQGKTLGHAFAFCESSQLLLDSSPGQSQPLIAHFDKYLISEDVQFVDRTPASFALLVAGPQARELISRVTAASAPKDMLESIAGRIAGCDVVVRRVPYAGASSFFIEGPPDCQGAVLRAIHEAGAVPCQSEAVEMIRLEAGFPLFGRDITDDNLPQEVGRTAQAISFHKGCYLGQETVARIDAVGHVNRTLTGFAFAGPVIPTAGMELQAGDKVVGHVTSAAWSGRLNAPLALGYVRSIHAKAGTKLLSPAGHATVTALPLHPG